MPRLIAALDADVLVPIVACDFVLTAFDRGLFEPVVSTRVLEEVEQTLLTDHPQLHEDAVSYRITAMREALEDQLVEPADIEVPDHINPKDRHVVAAALLGEATILTSNDRSLREQIMDSLPVLQPLSLDEFAVYMIQHSHEDVSAVVDHLVAKRTRPHITRDGMLAALANVMPSAVTQLRQTKPD